MITHLSNSQIYLYMMCSLKYRFQYIDKLPRTFKPSGLAFGSALHSALSWFHKERIMGNEVTLERLCRIFDADWYSQRVETEIRYKKGEDEKQLALMGKEMLGLYFDAPCENAKGTEVHFIRPLVNLYTGENLEIEFEGFFDLIEEDV